MVRDRAQPMKFWITCIVNINDDRITILNIWKIYKNYKFALSQKRLEIERNGPNFGITFITT